MVEACTLKDKISVLRKMVEDEYIKEDNDKEKLLRLSTELDKLIYEFFMSNGEQLKGSFR